MDFRRRAAACSLAASAACCLNVSAFFLARALLVSLGVDFLPGVLYNSPAGVFARLLLE